MIFEFFNDKLGIGITSDGRIFREARARTDGKLSVGNTVKLREYYIGELIHGTTPAVVSFRDMDRSNYSISNLDFIFREEITDNNDLNLWKRLVEYDPVNGRFYKKFTQKGSTLGSVCDVKGPSGYREVSIKIGGVRFRKLAHVLAYAIHNNAWPEGLIDHIDRSKTNNRIENLREVSTSQNAMNRKPKKDGLPQGVKKTKTGKYVASITMNYEQFHLGTFLTVDEAAEARLSAEKQYGIIK